MGGFLNSISAVLLILIMVVFGYIFGKAGWMNSSHKSFIVKFLINLAVPCMCINNIFNRVTAEMLQNAGMLLLVPMASGLLCFALAYGLGKLIKIEHKRFGGFVVMCAFSNAMFVGYPMCHTLFGDAGVPYVMFYYICNMVLFWTLGNYIIHRSGSIDGKAYSAKDSFKSLLTPPLLSLVVALLLLFAGFEMPSMLSSLFGYMSGAVTPLALLYIGFILYETGLKNIRLDKGMMAMMAMRFVLSPAIIIGMCALTGISGMGRDVFVIQAAMPVMTQSVIISANAGADEKYNALGMSLTTLACLVVVPVLMLILS